MNSAVNGAGRGRGWQRLPSTLVHFYVVPTHAPSPKDTSVTTHCHAAPAWLTREYQSDHRRYVLTPATTCAVHPICADHPLDNLFHIRSVADKGVLETRRSGRLDGGGGRGERQVEGRKG